MSKQLALSIALSVLAMTAFALLGTERRFSLDGADALRLPLHAQVPALPPVSHLIPALQ